MKLAVVDYGSGNLQSVGQALMAASRLAAIDVDLAITADPVLWPVPMLSFCRGLVRLVTVRLALLPLMA